MPHVAALVWDGAATVIQEFAKGQLEFTVGSGQVLAGLDEAVCQLRVGEEADVRFPSLLSMYSLFRVGVIVISGTPYFVSFRRADRCC